MRGDLDLLYLGAQVLEASIDEMGLANVGEIVAQTDVDGALVGGASLEGEQFATLSAIAAGGPLP